MDTSRPAFANSLVAMYGSGSSDDEDSNSPPLEAADLPPNSEENTAENSFTETIHSEKVSDVQEEGNCSEVIPETTLNSSKVVLSEVVPDTNVEPSGTETCEQSEPKLPESIVEGDLMPHSETSSLEVTDSKLLKDPIAIEDDCNVGDDTKNEEEDEEDEESPLPNELIPMSDIPEDPDGVVSSTDSGQPSEICDNIENALLAQTYREKGTEEADHPEPSSSVCSVIKVALANTDRSLVPDVVSDSFKTTESLESLPEVGMETSSDPNTESEFQPDQDKLDCTSKSTSPRSETSIEETTSLTTDSQNFPEKLKHSPSPGKSTTPGGRKLRQIRHPSAKAAEAAADAAFVAAVTPTRKNLKEAKIACALAKVNDTADGALSSKRTSHPPVSTRLRRGRSSSHERSSVDSRTSPITVSSKDSSSSSENLNSESSTMEEEKLMTISEETSSCSDDVCEREAEITQNKKSIEGEKPVGIKLKICRESVQILDPNLPKLEVQIPSETVSSEVSSSPGGSRRLRKLKEGTLSPVAPLSPITLKIAKSKEGLEVIPSEVTPPVLPPSDSEGKVEKITLKVSRGDGALIVKNVVDDSSDHRPEKLTLKLVKDEASNKFLSTHCQDDVEETKLKKITLKLSKNDSACIVKRKDVDSVSSSSDNDGGTLERITLKRSTDNNVSIVRPKDATAQLERGASASPEPGKVVEKITLKVCKNNDNVSIVKPSSPVPSGSGIEKLTLKMSKDGTAAVAGKQHDELAREGETSKLEKITLKLSRDDVVSIIKPASPVPERKALKSAKDEPLSPLPPLIISRSEEVEPQKERITLKLSKAGGHPSPVGVTDERSSWSIKSNDSDNVPSPVTSDPATPKSRTKRAFVDTSESVPSSAKRLKLSDMDKMDDSETIPVSENPKQENKDEAHVIEEEEMDLNPSLGTESGYISGKSTVLGEEAVAKSTTEEPMEVIQLDSEDSQGPQPAVQSNDLSISLIDIENEIPTSRIMRRKPRGRPRKTVLPPGAILALASADAGSDDVGSVPQAQTPRGKREKARPEPVESDRPKRSCKGREKPPPKPPKPVKPRGRAALAKQKLEQTIQPEEPQLFEEETRMSADCGNQPEILAPDPTNGLIAKVVVSRLPGNYQSATTTPLETPVDSPGPIASNEESQASQGSLSLISSTTESTPNRGNRKGRMEINVDPDAQAEFTVDMIAEYTWPLHNGHGETYMVQEQISSYLGVKSFKRKYPNMARRTVDHDERQYLLERKLVSESLCDLGLTALPSHEVLDVLCTDFPEKFEEYRRYTRERVQREFSNKQKAMLAAGGGKEDSKSKAMRNMASFNAMINRERRDQRRASFDLQSFTVHYPENRRRRMAVPNPPRVGSHPIALVPGQFTDYYKEFTAAELRYFPLNTVLYGPPLPHEMMRLSAGGSDGSLTESSDSSSSDSSSSDSDSSGSDSDSDSDSSSDSGEDSLSQAMPGTLEVPESDDRPDAVCRVCAGDRTKNKLGRPEALIHCASCEKSGHLSCLDLTVDMMPHIRKYSWHCTDCKLCAQCNDTADEDKMLFCDMCDRGYHIYCVGLRKVPEGRWHCQECALCFSCGARDPGGTEELQASQNPAPQDTPSKAEPPQWQHEFKKGDLGARIYVRTLCVPCSKLWKKGRYCRLCWKCFTNQPEEEGLINCSICDRWMHADCCRKAGRVIDVEKISSYICELCQQKGRVSVNKVQTKVLR